MGGDTVVGKTGGGTTGAGAGGGDAVAAAAAAAVGRVCWVLCIGSPWWPAVVVTRREMSENVADHLKPPHNPDFICIRYLNYPGSPYDYMRREKLRDFLAHFANLLSPATTRLAPDLRHAVQEAVWIIIRHGPVPQRNTLLCNAAIRSTCIHHKLKLALPNSTSTAAPATGAAAGAKRRSATDDDDDYKPSTGEESDESDDERPVVRRPPHNAAGVALVRSKPAVTAAVAAVKRKAEDTNILQKSAGTERATATVVRKPPPVDSTHPRRRKLATARKTVPCGGHLWTQKSSATGATAQGPRTLARFAAEKAHQNQHHRKAAAGVAERPPATAVATQGVEKKRRPPAADSKPRSPAATGAATGAGAGSSPSDLPRRPSQRPPKRPRTASPPALPPPPPPPPPPAAELDAVHRRLDKIEASMRAGFERLRAENLEAFRRREADSRAHFECMQALFHHEAQKTEDALKRCRATLPRKRS